MESSLTGSNHFRFILCCQLLLQLLQLNFTFVQAQANCSDRCCYWYHTIPGNNTECHPAEGTDVTLSCNIYTPLDIYNNSLGTVSWFKDIEGDTCTVALTETVGKYNISVREGSQPAGDGPVYQLYRDTYGLIIRNISSTDNGYYWCEIQNNETCFDPSPFVNISVNSSTISSDHSSESCASFNFGSDPGICATRMCNDTTYSSNCSTPQNFVTTTIQGPTASMPSPCHMNLHLDYTNCLILITVPTAGPVLILTGMMICCIGLCICQRKRKKRAKALSKKNDVGSAEVATDNMAPIDLATGQISQQARDVEAIMNSTDAQISEHPTPYETPISPDDNRQRLSIKSTRSATMELSMSCKTKTGGNETLKPHALPEESNNLTGKVTKGYATKTLDHTISADKLNKGINEQLTQEDKHGLIIPPHQPLKTNPQRKKHEYEDIADGPCPENPNETKDDGPMYDDVIQSSLSIRLPEASKPEDHKYHVLCSPTEIKTFQKGTATPHTPQPPSSKSFELHTYETVQTVPKGRQGGTEGTGELIFSEEMPTVRTPKHRDHQYEKVDDDVLHLPPRDIKREASVTQPPADHPSGSHLYSVLANPVDSNPLQVAVVQSELPNSTTMEDKYYSTAQVHRLVTVGRAIESGTDDHLYQELGEGNVEQSHLTSPIRDNKYSRHNTFTASTSMATKDTPGKLVRTFSESVERLDPMYDEPYQVKPQDTSAESAAGVKDIYNLDELFDDPKYAKDIQTRPTFDDPKYRTGASSQQQESKIEASQRHFSMHTSTGAVSPIVPPRAPIHQDSSLLELPKGKPSRSRITK